MPKKIFLKNFEKTLAFFGNLCYNNKAVRKDGKNLITVGIADVEGTPVPIPNTEVKLNSAENTWVAAPRENRKMPTYKAEYNLCSAFSFIFLEKRIIVNKNIF